MNRGTVLRLCVAFCLLNVALTAGLAAGGILKSVTTDATTFRTVGESPTYELPPDTRPFVREDITDADVFYSTAIRILNDIPVYATESYHYAPLVAVAFLPIALFGYTTFKLLLLVASALAVAAGTYLVLRAETARRGLALSRRRQVLLAAASVGFGPMVSNLKVGQISPFIYLSVAGFWYLYRGGRPGIAGSLLAIPALTKPYFLAPAAVVIARRQFRGTIGVATSIGAGLLAGAVVFGPETTVEYARIVVDYGLQSEASGVPPLAEWSVESVYPFFSLGVVSTLGRGAAVLGFGLLWVRYQQRGSTDNNAAALLGASTVMVMFVIYQASNIDLAVTLVGYLALGAHLYENGSSLAVMVLGASFTLCHVHPYAMEVLVGGGHANLAELFPAASSLLQLLQPAVYGLYLLGGLAIGVLLSGPAAEPLSIYRRREQRKGE